MELTGAPSPLRIVEGRDSVDLDVVHGFLSRDAYWCPGIPRDVVARALDHSLCFSAWRDGAQVGFARVVTDRATFAYLADVFVLPAFRGQRIAHAMMDAVMAHPDLQRLRRFLLATSDAHGVYAGYGFAALARPERFMERYDPQAYLG